MKNKKVLPMQKYQDINESQVFFRGKITVKAESRGIRKKLITFVTEREITKPSLGMGWLRVVTWTIQNVQCSTKPTNQSEKDRIITNFEKLVKTDRTIKDTDNKKNTLPGHPKKNREPDPHRIVCRVTLQRERTNKSNLDRQKTNKG